MSGTDATPVPVPPDPTAAPVTKPVTVQARMIAVGDRRFGKVVIGLQNSFLPANIDVVQRDEASGVVSTETFPRVRWMRVERPVV